MWRSVLLAVLLTAGGAEAATVQVYRGTISPHAVSESTTAVYFRGGDGERNDATVRAVGRTGLRFEDRSAPLRARRGCVQRGRHVAVCPVRPAYFMTIVALLGDRDDRWTPEPQAFYDGYYSGGSGNDVMRIHPGRRDTEGPRILAGGPGDDVLDGSRRYDEINGGRGDDVIRGGRGRDFIDDGPGRDVVRGGPGNDSVAPRDVPGPVVADRLDGGPGRDRLDYEGYPTGIRIALGRRGERDRLRGFEDLQATDHPDVITGTAGPNDIDPGEGADIIRAAGGDDLIYPLNSDSAEDDVTCGAGRDRAVGFGGQGLLRPDCEEMRIEFAAGPAQPVMVTETAVRLRVPCAKGPIRLATPA